jgi:pimeloyl-ACP methyl ester carboxylesterase
MHVRGRLRAAQPPGLLLLGFGVAYGWRKVVRPLAQAGYVMRRPAGYGRTTGWDGNYDGDLNSFRILNLIRDVLGLLSALGYRSVAGVIGHDFGSPVAAWCSLVRPDVFRSVALMSAPFAGLRCRSRPATVRRRRLHGRSRRGAERRARSCRGHGSTTSDATPPARPTRTCAAARRVSMRSARVLSREERGLAKAAVSLAPGRPEAHEDAHLLHHGP